MKLVTAAQMRVLEQRTVDVGATWSGLMEQAGWGVAQHGLALLGDARGRKIVVLVGPGNNGGDGLVVARHLHDGGALVALYLWRRSEGADDANWQRCRQRRIAEFRAEEDQSLVQLEHLLAPSDLVIDALLGSGLTRPLVGLPAELVQCVNRVVGHGRRAAGMRPQVLAVDLPSGIDSDSGQVCGVALQADLTVATGLAKRGILQYPGRAFAGTIVVADIGIALEHTEELMTNTLSAEHARALLPARPDDSHKGTFGKALILAGSLRYPGAALLATGAAVRSGAGLVTLACGRSLYPVLAARVPEATLLPLPEADWGTLGEEAAGELLKNIEGYRALLIGPGLGREEATGKLLQRLLGVGAAKKRNSVGFRTLSGQQPQENAEPQVELPPLVIDADALNLLAEIENWWERLGDVKAVLTPHPGEMARLLSVEQLADDRIQVAQDAAAHWGQVVVLKGAGTVVAAPDGRSLVDAAGGNPALATAGTGDVLSGLIAGLLAQGLEPFDAAALGVYLHSATGGLLRTELGDAGTAAGDLLPRLPLAMRALR